MARTNQHAREDTTLEIRKLIAKVRGRHVHMPVPEYAPSDRDRAKLVLQNLLGNSPRVKNELSSITIVSKEVDEI